MISKEQLPSNTDTGTEPDALPDLLKQALQDAYPDPKGQIASQVMAQIRAERENAERRHRAEKAELRRRRQGLIMKYGGLAACMVILSGALVIASPHLDRAADTAAMEADMVQVQNKAAADTNTADIAVPEIALYIAEEGYAAYSDEDAAGTDSNEEAEAEETAHLTASAGQSKSTEIETEPAAGTTTFKMTSRSREADDPAADAVLSDAAPAEAAEAPVQETQELSEQEAFAQYLIANGYMTDAEYRQWNAARADADPWTPEELCGAFGADPSVYAEFAAQN